MNSLQRNRGPRFPLWPRPLELELMVKRGDGGHSMGHSIVSGNNSDSYPPRQSGRISQQKRVAAQYFNSPFSSAENASTGVPGVNLWQSASWHWTLIILMPSAIVGDLTWPQYHLINLQATRFVPANEEVRALHSSSRCNQSRFLEYKSLILTESQLATPIQF